MTREQQIKQLEVWKNCMRVDTAEPDMIETYDMAIKALEQLEVIKEKAELNEDYCTAVGLEQIAGAFREIIDICKGVGA